MRSGSSNALERRREDPAGHLARGRQAQQRQHGRRHVEQGRLLDARAAADPPAVEVEDALRLVVAVAHPPQVAGAAGVGVQRAELETVIRQHHQGRPGVHLGHEGADDAIRQLVDRFHRPAEPLALRLELARQVAAAEQVAEEVRRGVGRLDVDHHQVRPLFPPQADGDVAVGERGGDRPLQMAEVVVEGERPRQLVVIDPGEGA